MDTIFALKRPRFATRVQGINTTAVTSTTARTVLAAASAGNSIYIQSITATNESTGAPLIRIKDSAGSPAQLLSFTLDTGAATATGPNATRYFDFSTAPIKVASGLAVTAEASATAGSTYVTIVGYTLPDSEPGL